MTLNLPFFRQLAKALAKQFGDNCEVVLHDLTSTDIEHSVVLVENQNRRWTYFEVQYNLYS